MGINNQYENKRLKRLFLSRLLGSISLLLVFTWFSAYTAQEHPYLLQQAFFLWFILSVLQAALFSFPRFTTGNLLCQLTSDLILIGLLIFGSGGLTSPIIFLLGVVIITAGTQAKVLVVLITAVLACITYLLAIYTYASMYNQEISHAHTLHILLQISLFFLAGGIMALIARRHADLQLERSHSSSQHHQLQKLHNQVINSMQESIIILDEGFNIQDFNDATVRILNISPERIGQSLYSILTIPTSISDFVKHNKLDTFRAETRHNQQFLLLTLTRLIEKKSAWLMTIVDISETRELEQQLAEQDKLASIGQMAAMLAHEIRNPMQTISQAVELMDLGSNDKKLEHIITDEISRLNRLVSDMLDYASPLHPSAQSENVKTLIQASISQIDLQNQHLIQFSCPDESINIDADHFRLVIDNLLRNAVIASPDPSSIHVTFNLKGDEWSLSVRDHGSGISKELTHSLFEPFQTGRKQGTGLGLATVWQVCQVNNWIIHIDNIIQSGACFIVQNHPKRKKMLGEKKHG